MPSALPSEFEAVLVKLYTESATAPPGRKELIEDAIEKVRACAAVWGKPTPEQARISELEAALRVLCDSVERIACEMPPPNEFTPQFKQRVQAARVALQQK